MQVRRVLGLVCAALLLAGTVVVAAATGATDQRRATTTDARALAAEGEELTGERTRISQTFRTERGAFVTRVFAAPVHRGDSAGALSRLSDELQPDGSVLELRGGRATARLPKRLGDGAIVRVTAGSHSIGYRLLDTAERDATLTGTTAVYEDARPGADLSLTALDDGVKETLSLASSDATRQFVYDLVVPDGGSARTTAAGGIAIDVDGEDSFEITPPFMHDAERRFAPSAATKYTLERAGDGYRLTLALSSAWLTAKGRVFPVTVDPTVRRTGTSQTVDTSLVQSVPNTAYGAAAGLFVGEYASEPGYDNRGLVKFDLATAGIPTDAKVLQADMGLKSYYRENTTAKKIGVHALTHDFTTNATWNKYDGTTAWVTAGGTFDSTPSAVATVGTQLGWHHWYPTALAQAWINGSQPNYGLLLKDRPSEPKNGSEFRSSEYGTAADRPYLDIVWYPRTGDPGAYTFDDHPLQDGTVLRTNVFNGNLLFERPDVAGTGPGQDFSMSRYFNSKAADADPIHTGFPQAIWSSSNGKFVGATVMDNGDFIYQGPGGYLVTFAKQSDGSFVNPPELDATLVANAGAPWAQRYAMTLPDGTVMKFAEDGTWSSQTDASSNTFTLNYPSPSYQHTSVTGTNSQNTTFTYTGTAPNEKLVQTTNPASQNSTYTYTSDRLTSDARNGTTQLTYGYDTTTGRLNRITDAAGRVTQIVLDSSNRVTQIIDGANSTDPTTTYAYAAASSPCETGAVRKTTVTNPDATVHIYCTDADGTLVNLSTTAAESPVLDSIAAAGYADEHGVTQYVAQGVLNLQGKAQGLGADVAASSSGTGYAGTWFDDSTRRIKVGLKTGTTSAGATAAISARGISASTDIVTTNYTVGELENGRDSILSAVSSLVSSALVTAGFDTTTNTAKVTVANSLTPTQLSQVNSARAASGVATTLVTAPTATLATGQLAACNNASCDPPFRGGVRMSNAAVGGCTSGFIATGVGTRPSVPYVMTAGHCVLNSGVWELPLPVIGAPLNVGSASGQFADRRFGADGDFGVIPISSTNGLNTNNRPWVYVRRTRQRVDGTSKIARLPHDPSYHLNAGPDPQHPATELNSMLSIICFNGMVTGTRCGQVTDLGVKSFAQGSNGEVGYQGLIRMFECGPGKRFSTGLSLGDSGAPFVKRHKGLGLTSHRNPLGLGDCVVSFSGAQQAENVLHVQVQGQ